MIKRKDQEFVEMANNSFVKMMQKVLYYPNGKKYYARLSEEFIPFAKLLLDEYERISPIKFDVPDVELINDKTESDYNTFKARFKEFEDVCSNIPNYLQDFISNKISIEQLIDFFVNQYLSSYFAIGKDAVFSPGNYNRNCNQFRTSDFFKNLVQFPIIYNNGIPESMSYLEPTALDNIVNTINTAKYLYNTITEKEKIKFDIFLNAVQKKFYRDFVYNREDYNIIPCSAKGDEYHSDLKIVPRDELLSVKRVNINSLYNKIVPQIIEKKAKCTKDLSFSVSLFGLVGKEELKKLSSEILKWYNKIDSPKPNLSLYFTVYKNETTDTLVDIEDDNCKINFKTIDYKKNKFIIWTKISSLIDYYDMTFILNCPWLKNKKDYDGIKDGSLHAFGEVLEDLKYGLTVVNKEKIKTLNPECNSYYGIRKVTSNYIRMIDSDTYVSGEILWCLVGTGYDKLKEKINKIENDTTVYLYVSDDAPNIGEKETKFLLRKSAYNNEQHYGNLFYVAKLSNKKEKSLPMGNSADFIIPLIGFIDKIPINYEWLQESLNQALNGTIVDIGLVCKNVYIVGTVDGHNMNSVILDTRLGEGINNLSEKTRLKILSWSKNFSKILLKQISPFYSFDVLNTASNTERMSFDKKKIARIFMDLVLEYAQNIKTLVFHNRLMNEYNTGCLKFSFLSELNKEPIKDTVFPIIADKLYYQTFMDFRNIGIERNKKEALISLTIAQSIFLNYCLQNYDYGKDSPFLEEHFGEDKSMLKYYIKKIIAAFEALDYTPSGQEEKIEEVKRLMLIR